MTRIKDHKEVEIFSMGERLCSIQPYCLKNLNVSLRDLVEPNYVN